MNAKLIPLACICACAGLARADFNPVPLTPSSYTFGIVGPLNTVQALPYCITATAGTGASEGDNTYYEQGFHSPPGYPGANSGLPTHNTVFTNISNSNMTFLMPPTYLTNNDLMVYSGFSGGTFTFTTPTTATNLAILGADGNGSMTINYTVTHADLSTEFGPLNALDWFNGASGNTTVAWGANGRVTAGGGFNNYNGSAVNNNAPYLYAYQINVSSNSPVVSITFNYVSGSSYGNFFAVSGNASGPAWTPIPVTGFNQMTIVPATVPFPVTATMDNGTNLVALGNTWFEQGYFQGNNSDGLPPSGSTFSSSTQPTHHYQMGNYYGNNAILLDTNHLTATITPAFPAAYASFAFLTAGGNIGTGNKMTNICIMEHLDGTNETNVFIGYDWFESTVPAAVAYVANGRVNMSGRTLNTLGGGNPKLFESYFPLQDVASPVTNILLKNVSVPGASATTFIMAVSASSGGVPPLITQNPQPATQTWYPGQTATFSVQVTGTAPINNIWLVEKSGAWIPLTDGVDANGSVISGSSTTTLTISSLASADGTNYEYEATNAFGGEISAPALLTINTGTPVGPIIDSQIPDVSLSPLSVFTNLPNKTNLFSVAIDASSSPPFFYQWYRGLPQNAANAITNATNATYGSVDTVNVTISCVVSNFVRAVTSAPVALTAATALSYQTTLMAYKPVGYWPLTETAGTTAFDYAGNNNGTYKGNFVLGADGLPETTGLNDDSTVLLDGVSAYVDIPVGNLNITGPMTLIEWINTTGESGFTGSMGHADSGYRFDVDSSGQAHFADQSPDVMTSTAVTDGQWHQLIGTYDGTTEVLYVDGKAVAQAAANAPSGSGYDVYIGGAPDYDNRFFAGTVAQAAILTNALTASQVSALYYSLNFPPSVYITPASPSIYSGANLTLTAVTNGSPPLSFQWYYIDDMSASNNIPGATNDTYTITNAPITLNGYTYGVDVTNDYAGATASVQLMVTNGVPMVLDDISPLNGEAYFGAPVTYTVYASGSLPLLYQWMVDGNNVSGATDSSFTGPAALGVHTTQVAIYNAFSGDSPTRSSLAKLQGDPSPTNITFNNGTGWRLNTAGAGATVPTLNNNVLELTDGNGGEASSAFYDVAQYVGNFAASFTYTATGSADGVAFVLQNSAAGSNALGEAGGALGYYPITNSAALEINLFQFPGIALATNGETYGDGGGLIYQGIGGVVLNSADPIDVQLIYTNGVLAVSLTDAVTSVTFSTNYSFGSLTPVLGGTDLAYIGFSGGDGGETATQTISNFMFTAVNPVAQIITSPLSNTTVNLGSNAIFTVTAGGANPVFQWTEGSGNTVLNTGGDSAGGAGVIISTIGNSSTLTLVGVTDGDDGPITVTVTTALSGVSQQASSSAILSVYHPGVAPLTIFQQPSSELNQPLGSNVSLFVTAQSSFTNILQYQWLRNGVIIPPSDTNFYGANNSELSIPVFQAIDSGVFTVEIADGSNVIVSQQATVTASTFTAPGEATVEKPYVLPQTNQFTLVSANTNTVKEKGTPDIIQGDPGGSEIWFQWSPPGNSNGIVTFSTLGSGFDTTLGAYIGSSPSNLTQVPTAINDDDGAGYANSQISFYALAGTTYLIAVDGFFGAQGNVVLSWKFNPGSEAIPLTIATPLFVVSSNNATVTLSDPWPGNLCDWFLDGQIVGIDKTSLTIANLSSNNVGTYVASLQTADGFTVFSEPILVEINAQPDNTAASNSVILTKYQSSVNNPFVQPAQGQVIKLPDTSGYSESQAFNTAGSNGIVGGSNPVIPGPYVGACPSWYSFTPAVSGLLEVSTVGSSFHALLAVYATPVTHTSLPYEGATSYWNTNNNGANPSVYLYVTGGVTYAIFVEGISPGSGVLDLGIFLSPGPASQNLTITQSANNVGLSWPNILVGYLWTSSNPDSGWTHIASGPPWPTTPAPPWGTKVPNTVTYTTPITGGASQFYYVGPTAPH